LILNNIALTISSSEQNRLTDGDFKMENIIAKFNLTLNKNTCIIQVTKIELFVK